MHKALWFLVGLLYFVLVWLNQVENSALASLPWAKEAGLIVALISWTAILSLACSKTFTTADRVSAPKLRRLAGAGLGSLIVQYILGALSRNYHAGLSCPNFPACAEGFLPFNFESTLAFLHRWWGILMLGLFIHLSIAALKSGTELLRSARRASSLSVAQVFLGIGVVMTQLHPDSRVCHVAVGYALWGVLAYIRIRTQSPELTPTPSI
jgi:heme A synthase